MSGNSHQMKWCQGQRKWCLEYYKERLDKTGAPKQYVGHLRVDMSEMYNTDELINRDGRLPITILKNFSCIKQLGYGTSLTDSTKQ